METRHPEGGRVAGGLVHKLEFKYRFRETFKLKRFFGVNFFRYIFLSIVEKLFITTKLTLSRLVSHKTGHS